jgi:hypothetical protein
LIVMIRIRPRCSTKTSGSLASSFPVLTVLPSSFAIGANQWFA